MTALLLLAIETLTKQQQQQKKPNQTKKPTSFGARKLSGSVH